MGGSEVSLLELVRGLRRLVPPWHLDVVVPRDGPLPRASRVRRRRSRAAAARGWRVSAKSAVGAGGDAAVAGRRCCWPPAASRPTAGGSPRLLAAISPDIVHTNGFKLHVLGPRAVPPAAALVWHIHEYVARRPDQPSAAAPIRRPLRRHRGELAQRRRGRHVGARRSTPSSRDDLQRRRSRVSFRRTATRSISIACRACRRRPRNGPGRPRRDVRPLERTCDVPRGVRRPRSGDAMARLHHRRRAVRHCRQPAHARGASAAIAAAGLNGSRRSDGVRRASGRGDARARRRGPRQHAARAVRTGHRRRTGHGSRRHRERRRRRGGARAPTASMH